MRLNKNNQGTSMIELVVAMAIASIILVMIMFFMNTATFSFRRTSDDVNLQLEAQTTINQISNLAMEAKAYIPPAVVGGRYIFEYKDNEYYAIVFQDSDKKIYLVPGTTFSEAELTAIDMKQHFMADYVEDFIIEVSANGKSVTIDLKLALGQDEYQLAKKVRLRNLN